MEWKNEYLRSNNIKLRGDEKEEIVVKFQR